MIQFECGHCGNAIKLPDEAAGRKGKCNKCGESLTVPEPGDPAGLGYSLADLEESELEMAPILPRPKKRKAAPPVEDLGLLSRLGRISLSLPAVVGIGVGSLALGYFAGREHVKLQFAAALRAAGDEFVKAMESKRPKVEEKADVSLALRKTAAPSAVVDLPAEKAPEPLKVGQTFENETIAVTLTGVRVEKPEIRNRLNGKTYRDKDDSLLVSFRIRNKQPRKIVTFYNGEFADSRISARDDVDNEVRHGLTESLVAALASGHDIPPESDVAHTERFDVPLPKTEHITVRFDLRAVQGKGVIEYRIGAAEIDGFPLR